MTKKSLVFIHDLREGKGGIPQDTYFTNCGEAINFSLTQGQALEIKTNCGYQVNIQFSKEDFTKLLGQMFLIEQKENARTLKKIAKPTEAPVVTEEVKER